MIADAARIPPASTVAMQQPALQALHFAGLEFADSHLLANAMVGCPHEGHGYMLANVRDDARQEGRSAP